ncbi:winged helix-turn-helix domain-containing protein [Saliphagus sp. LR7]|uniref:ArsR/SmtB family transcription factor n=1 Tax=Saliphagus sp. LR7 TaxID=2282654 RepID=UPI000DF7827C|nr:winged helix-turn-helix domain-containing protein [Saliphagus sp. LR7]
MSGKANDAGATTVPEPTRQLDVLGDDCARTILVATSEGPHTAKELADRTNCSSATVYRRLNDLLESDLVEECIRFADDGSHTTAYEATVDRVHVEIGGGGIDVGVVRSGGPSNPGELE